MTADPAVLRRELTALAARQAGYFTAAQAREVGYSYPAQKYHVDRGNWERARRGIFRIPNWPAREDDTYVLWDLWSAGRAVLSHETALAVRDLGDVNPVHVHMTVPPGFRAGDPALVLHRADLGLADVEDREGYRVTTVERSLLDTAAGDMSQELVESAISDAVSRRLVRPRHLRSRSDEFGPRAALRIERALSAEKAEA
ncbi:MAG: type IV toxin-antitoxin system AbiEi family antitoxin domain-containing protein [Streptosporangiales bacterium]|jgi:predicted transcriptional regulator of viral defense system|nr:type IV toxin-antitoxin system AbiEi family antitoxin domain-containing protein [Streptosporangiales bacterium]